MDMFAALLQIKNYKLFVANMFLLGMGIDAVAHIFFFATKDLGMTTNQYGLLLASAAISQFTVNSIIARFSDTHHFNRKIIIILAFSRWVRSFFNILFCRYNLVIHITICDFSRIICTSNAPTLRIC